jgi:hypothetical protein
VGNHTDPARLGKLPHQLIQFDVDRHPQHLTHPLAGRLEETQGKDRRADLGRLPHDHDRVAFLKLGYAQLELSRADVVKDL